MRSWMHIFQINLIFKYGFIDWQTVRFRDSMEQERVAIDRLDAYFADKFTF